LQQTARTPNIMVRTRLEMEHTCIAWLRTFSSLGLKVNGGFVAHSGFWLEVAIATGSIILLLYGSNESYRSSGRAELDCYWANTNTT
jgi:hypothetical protein